MAVKVMPARGMNAVSARTFETATKYTIDGGMLHIYEGTKRIATFFTAMWESAEIIELLDQKAPDGGRYGQQTGATFKTKTRNGSGIRTSPHKDVRKAGKKS